MADPNDFVPDATPASAPVPQHDDFVPDTVHDDFVPDAPLAEPTPHQAYRASVKALAAGSPEQPAGVGAPQPTDYTTERVPPAELAKQWGDVAYGVPKGAAAFPAGGFMGDVESMGRHLVGAKPETYFPTTVEGGYLGPKGVGLMNPASNPEEAIGMAAGAMLLPGPKVLRAIKGEKKPPAMPPVLAPERNPLGVTLTGGEATGDLALRQREQAAIRGADPHAQAFMAQREAQIEAAQQNVTRGLDPAGTVFAENPLDAADVISQDLTHREDLARTGRQAEAAALQPLPLPHPLDSAETVGTSLRNSADTLAQTRQTRVVALQNSREDLRTSLSPTNTVLASSPTEAADIVSGAVGQAAENAQAATTAAYDQLRTLPGQFHPASFNTVGDEIVADLNKGANPIRVNPQTTPQAHAALGDLTDILSDVSQERDPVTGQIVKRPPVTPQVVETARQRLNSFYGDALQAARSSNNWSDVRAMRGVMDAFDDAVTTRLTDGRFTGGNAADVAATMRWARGQHAEYRKTFTPQGAGDSVGAAVQQIVGRHEGQAAPPNQIAGMLYGNGPLPVKVAKRLNSVFDPGSPEIGAIKQGLFSHITERPEGVTAWGPEQVADRIYDFINGKGRGLAREYLTPAEQASWKAYADDLRTSVAPPPKPGDAVAQVLGKITGEKGPPSTPAEIADTLFGRSNVGENATGVKLAQHIKDTYGTDSEAFEAVRNGMAARLLRTTEGSAGWDPESIANSIDDFLTKRGRPMANTLYTAEEQATWQRYADALRSHADTYGAPTTPVGRAIARISGADGRPPALPAEVQNMLWGRAMAQDKEVPVGVAKYLKDLYGETSPKWSAVKQGLFQKMVEPGGNLKNWGPGRIANQISRFLDTDGRDLSNIIYSPQERASIRAYGDLMRKIEMPTGSYFPSAPGINPMLSVVANRIGQLIGAIVGSHVPGIPRIVGEFAGITIGGRLEKAAERWHNNISKQLPIVADEIQKWQRAQARAAKNPNWATNQGSVLATTLLQKSLAPLGIDLSKLPLQLPSGARGAPFDLKQLQGPGSAAAEDQQPKQRADGGATDDNSDLGSNYVTRRTAPFPEKPEGYEYLEAKGAGADTPGPAAAPLSSGLEQPAGAVSTPSPSPTPSTPKEPPADVPTDWSTAGFGPAVDTSEGLGSKALNRLTGAGGEERHQLWPEKMIRSGATLAGDVSSGKEPDYTGLRREDFTDIPGDAQPMDSMIQRTQDMAALAGGSGFAAAEEGALGMAGGKLTQPPILYKNHVIRDYGDHVEVLQPRVEGGFKPFGNETAKTVPVAKYMIDEIGNPDIISGAYRKPGYQPTTLEDALAAYGAHPKELTVNQLYTPQEMMKRGEQFDIPDPSKLGIQKSRTFEDNPQDMFFVTQPDPAYASYAPHVTKPITGFFSRKEAEDFIRAAQQKQQRPADYAGPSLYSDTSKPGAALSALEHANQPFYSTVENAIANAPQQKMHASQWAGWLKNQPGVKGEELSHLGLDNPETTLGKGIITKDQVLAHAKENGVQLKEVEKGNKNEAGITRLNQEYERANPRPVGNINAYAEWKAKRDTAVDQQLDATREPKFSDYQLPGGENYREMLLTKPLPKVVKVGGHDYRIKLPNGDYATNGSPGSYSTWPTDMQARTAANGMFRDQTAAFRTSHWDEPNVLAHMRMNDRDIPGVGKSLHLEELQSDWAQKGRKEGFATPDRPDPAQLERSANVLHQKLIATLNKELPVRKGNRSDEIEQRIAELENTPAARQNLAGPELDEYDALLRERGTLPPGAPRTSTASDHIDDLVNAVDHGMVDRLDWKPTQEQIDLAKQYNDAWGKYKEAATQPKGVPNMPFKTTWPDLLLKRAITKAAQEGKDAISWTPGEQQAARYDLSKQIKSLDVRRLDDGHLKGQYALKAVDHNGKTVLDDAFPKEKLADVVGKDMAKRIEENGPDKYEGLDLKVGGEGMKSFYDKMLVDKANAIGKKYGAKVEWKDLPSTKSVYTVIRRPGANDWIVSSPTMGDVPTEAFNSKAAAKAWIEQREKPFKVPVLRLTPKLKEQALSRGMPLFSDTAKPGAALSGLEKMKQVTDAGKGTQIVPITGKFKTAASYTDPKGYTVTIKAYKKPSGPHGPQGEIHVTNPAGKTVESTSSWMDYPEPGWKYKGIDLYKDWTKHEKSETGNSSVWRTKVPLETRLRMEAKQQGIPEGDYGPLKAQYNEYKGHAADALEEAKHPYKQMSDAELHKYLWGKASGGAVNANPNQNHIPRPITQQPHSGQPAQEQNRAHGGRVNPDNINHAPSDAQKHAGNYAKDLVHLHGLEIKIENVKGSTRKGVDKNGKAWEAKLPMHYGYIRKTTGADQDNVDVYLGPHLKSHHVYLIDQVHDDTKKFDEHKILMGFGNQQQAINYYKRAFSDGKGQARIGAIHGLTIAELKLWLAHGDTKTPFKSPQVKKLSHAEVGYKPRAKNMDHRCFNCVHFVPARHGGPACILVASPISPQAWCSRFRRKRL